MMSMRAERIAAHIRQRLAELDGQADMREVVDKGRFSFGLDEKSYGHLPGWRNLVVRKKKMVRLVWLLAFFVSFLIVFVAGDFGSRFAGNWLKATAQLFATVIIVGLFYAIGAFYSLFVEFRKTEREVRRLIYQDILFQLKEEKETV